MKINRFFIQQQLKEGDITIADQAVIHQMRDVLRLRAGNPVILLDGEGNVLHGEIKLLTKKEAVVSSDKIEQVQKERDVKVKLYASMIKKDKYEWVLQKGTELGVVEFHPVISARTEKPNLNMERAEKIVREASEQSERFDLPIVSQPKSLEEALESCGETKCIALHMDGNRLEVSHLKEVGDISIFVGPEGGWDEKDMEIFKRHNVEIVSLGEQVLRAETASVAVASLLLLG